MPGAAFVAPRPRFRRALAGQGLLQALTASQIRNQQGRRANPSSRLFFFNGVVDFKDFVEARHAIQGANFTVNDISHLKWVILLL